MEMLVCLAEEFGLYLKDIKEPVKGWRRKMRTFLRNLSVGKKTRGGSHVTACR